MVGDEACRCILAIDLGTSAAKVALVSTSGEIIAREAEETELLLYPDGGAEQDPAEWWRAIKAATRRLLAGTGVPADNIVAVGCTGQWSGTVAVDRQGNPLMNAIIWMDSRGARYVQGLARGVVNIEGYGLWKLWHWLRLSGGIMGHAGKDPTAHILYIKHEHPDVYARTYKFLEPKDYLNLRLTGKFAASHDSIALHWLTDNRDIENIVYSPRLIRMCGLRRETLPDLLQATEILGPIQAEVAQELGLPETAQVILGTPDVQSAAIGSGAVEDFKAHLYIGTSSWLTCHVPFKKVSIQSNMTSLPSALPGRYLIGNEQACAGVCLRLTKDGLLGLAKDWGSVGDPSQAYEILENLASAAPPGSNKVIFSPWLYGERTPVDDRFIRGGFHNLSLRNTRGDLLRAVFEGVAYNGRWLLEAVERFAARRLEPIRLIGGGARSALWCQIHADVFNRTIEQVENPVDANVRGIGLLAAVALGHLRTDEIAERVQVARVFRPTQANRGVYDQLFGEFVNIYRANRAIHRRLNETPSGPPAG